MWCCSGSRELPSTFESSGWCASNDVVRFYADDIFVSFFFPDEDDEAQRNTVPLAPLDSLFSDTDSLKPQKKKKAKKMKEGKMPKVKKRKKEVRCNSRSSAACHDPGHTTAWQELRTPSFSIWQTTACLTSPRPQGAFLAAGVRPRGLPRPRRGSWQRCQPHCHSKLWAPRPRLENRFRHVALWLMAASGGHSGALRQASSGHRSIKTTTGLGFCKPNEHCT